MRDLDVFGNISTRVTIAPLDAINYLFFFLVFFVSICDLCRFIWCRNTCGARITSFAVSIWKISRRTRRELSRSSTSSRGQTTKFRRRQNLCSTLGGASGVVVKYYVKKFWLEIFRDVFFSKS